MPENPTASGLRIDKWLWAVRLFKTRSMATAACRTGKVFSDGEELKPSRDVKEGMIVEIKSGPLTKTVKVIGILEKRVGAKLVANYMEDLTPDEEYKKLELIKAQPSFRERGLGRPTKKERRDIDKWTDDW